MANKLLGGGVCFCSLLSFILCDFSIAKPLGKVIDNFEYAPPDEYQTKKAKLLGEKADIEQEIRDFEQKGNNWLEPMREVILQSSQAKILLSQGTKRKSAHFSKMSARTLC